MLKNKVIINRSKEVFNDEKFKIVYLFLICINVYAAINTNINLSLNENYLYASSGFYTFFLFAILLYSMYITCNIFNRNYSILMRMDNKRKYLKELIILNTFIIITVLLLNFMILSIFLQICFIKTVNKSIYEPYGISFLLYNIMFYIKYIVILTLIVNLFLLIYSMHKDIILILAMALVLFTLINGSTSVEIINGFSNFNINPIAYLSPLVFSTLSYEITMSILTILLLMIMVYLLYNISLTTKININ